MRGKGEDLLQSIKSMRSFLGDLGQLMMTAESLMGERSWEPAWGQAGCVAEMSSSISAGHLWMPREAARAYKNEQAFPNVFAMIAVLLDDYDREYNLAEPVVSASYFVYPETGDQETPTIPFWYAKWFGWCGTSVDGAPVSQSRQDDGWQDSWKWDYMQVFGHPLVEITNEKMLAERIVDPLLKLMENHASAG